MDRFEQYKTGKVEVPIEGEKPVHLLLSLSEKHEILKAIKSLREESDEEYGTLQNLLFNILVKSYPETKKEMLEAFAVAKGDSVLTGLSIAFGWTTKEKMAEFTESQLKKLTLEEGSEPRKTSGENSLQKPTKESESRPKTS